MSKGQRDGPIANDLAIQYLDSFDFKQLGKSVFTENLVTVSECGKEIGEMSVSVEETVRGGEICYLVHAHSQGVVDNVPCGTSVTAYVGKGLVTFEQTQHEFMKVPKKSLDKKTLLVKEGNQYFIRRIINQGGLTTESEKSYSATELTGFVSEGASIILQRTVGQSKHVPENATFLALDPQLEMSTVAFKCHGDSFLTVGDKKASVFGVERQLDMGTKSPLLWRTFFLESGHIAHRSTVGSPVSMQISHLPECKEITGETHAEKPLRWQEDMELTSHFVGRKKELSDNHSAYVRHQPELRALMSDFLQFLLLRKPDDVCSFASDYFSSFGSKGQTPSTQTASSSVI